MKISRFFPLFGILLFLYIILNVDFIKIFEVLKNINIFYLIISLLLGVPIIVIKALKWKLLIKAYKINYSLIKSITSWLVGFSFGIVTPGRVGDLVRVLYLKEKVNLGKSLTTVIVDRVIDILILFCLAIFGIISFVMFYTEIGALYTIVPVIFVLFLVAVYLLTKKRFVYFLLKPIFKITPNKHKTKIDITIDNFYSGLNSMKRKKHIILSSTILGILAWFFLILQFYFFGLSLNLNLSYQFLLIIVPIITLLDALPISFAGIGTRDAALIFFFTPLLLAPETAISFSLLILFFNYALTGIIGLLIWFKNPIKISHKVHF